jgi:Transposase domain (DUF772)
MLRDRYTPVDLVTLVPALGLAFEPVLARLDVLLEDDALFRAVRDDLARRRPRTLETGRPSTPVEVLVRLLIVKRLYGWSYAETEHFVSDSLILRQFCRLGLERVPDDTTLLRWANLLQPATLERLLDHVVALARQLKVTRGRKLRVDSTVVQTPVHYPTRACWSMGCGCWGGWSGAPNRPWARRWLGCGTPSGRGPGALGGSCNGSTAWRGGRARPRPRSSAGRTGGCAAWPARWSARPSGSGRR